MDVPHVGVGDVVLFSADGEANWQAMVVTKLIPDPTMAQSSGMIAGAVITQDGLRLGFSPGLLAAHADDPNLTHTTRTRLTTNRYHGLWRHTEKTTALLRLLENEPTKGKRRGERQVEAA